MSAQGYGHVLKRRAAGRAAGRDLRGVCVPDTVKDGARRSRGGGSGRSGRWPACRGGAGDGPAGLANVWLGG